MTRSHRYELLRGVAVLLVASSSTQSRPEYSLNVLDFGATGSPGNRDNTAAFQRTLDAAALQRGAIVVAPAGIYRFTGALFVPSGVTLQGSFSSAPWDGYGLLNGSHTAPPNGTVFHATGGRGSSSTDTAFITLAADATLAGVTIFYPEQHRGTGPPVPYPWTVALAGSNAALTDSLLLNSWNAINATLAPRHYIARVQGQPINIGLYIDQCFDIGRVENVHWHTGWRWLPGGHDLFEAGAYLHQVLHGRGFVIARTDWQSFLNTFALNYAVGYHFIISPPDGMFPGERTASGHFIGIGSDVTRNATILVEDVKANAIVISEASLVVLCDNRAKEAKCDQAPRTHVIVESTNTGTVKIVNSALWGQRKRRRVSKAAGPCSSSTRSSWRGDALSTRLRVLFAAAVEVMLRQRSRLISGETEQRQYAGVNFGSQALQVLF